MYTSTIPRLAPNHPDLPQNLIGTLDLDQDIQQGTPTNPANSIAADEVVNSPQDVHPQTDDNLPPDAKDRATAIRNAHANAQYNIGDHAILQALGRMVGTMERMGAMVVNTRIMDSNRYNASAGAIDVVYRPRQKESPGHGGELVRALGGNVPNPPAEAQVGSVPPAFNATPGGYTHEEIYRLMYFYNDDFGIVQGDSILVRREKLKAWLSVA